MKLSVIVCTRNRAHAILPCLNSIVAAIAFAAPVDAELIVVDNASTDDTFAMVTKWACDIKFSVRLIQEMKKGLSHARNAGIATAQGNLILFTDDDCRYDETYIRNTIAHYNHDSAPVMRGGSVVLGDPTDLSIGVRLSPLPMSWSMANHDAKKHSLTTNSLIGCNMVLPMSLIQKVGPFDTRLGAGSPLHGGEDIDYILRVYLSGATIAYQPDMKIHHFHGRKTIEDGRALRLNYFLSAGALYAKFLFRYPDFCKPFYWDFKKMVKDIIKRQNSFMPELNLSFVDLIRQNIKGALLYFIGALKP
jgi:glycosyltransferase involved in cell wall biosynthesis